MKSLFRMREEAAERGEVRFDPGFPCVQGHHAERYVSDGRCVECARLHAAKRQRQLQEARERSRGAVS